VISHRRRASSRVNAETRPRMHRCAVGILASGECVSCSVLCILAASDVKRGWIDTIRT